MIRLQEKHKIQKKNIEQLLNEMDIGIPINDDDKDAAADDDNDWCTDRELIRLLQIITEKLREQGCLDIHSKWCKKVSNDTLSMETFMSVFRC